VIFRRKEGFYSCLAALFEHSAYQSPGNSERRDLPIGEGADVIEGLGTTELEGLQVDQMGSFALTN
jgi:hypothetical protein